MSDRDFEDHCWRDVFPEETLSVYAPYRRETFVGPTPALLAIDLYRMAYEGGNRPIGETVREHPSACGAYAWAAIQPTRRVIAAARSAGIPVIYTTAETRPQASPAAIPATKRKGAKIAASAFEIYEAFAPEPEDLIVYKMRASAFFGTPLTAHLTQLGVRSLIVCGESTSGCVRASVVDAYSHGFHVSIAEEACFDRSPLSHKVNLFDMHHKYADVMNVQEIVEALGADGALGDQDCRTK